MPRYMLDTDTVSFALRGQGRVAARLLEHRPSDLCISSITLAELRFGAEARRSPETSPSDQYLRGVR
jgi:tRNA(fMet)-specific endonuclease VapC